MAGVNGLARARFPCRTMIRVHTAEQMTKFLETKEPCWSCCSLSFSLSLSLSLSLLLTTLPIRNTGAFYELVKRWRFLYLRGVEASSNDTRAIEKSPRDLTSAAGIAHAVSVIFVPLLFVFFFSVAFLFRFTRGKGTRKGHVLSLPFVFSENL